MALESRVVTLTRRSGIAGLGIVDAAGGWGCTVDSK